MARGSEVDESLVVSAFDGLTPCAVTDSCSMSRLLVTHSDSLECEVASGIVAVVSILLATTLTPMIVVALVNNPLGWVA